MTELLIDPSLRLASVTQDDARELFDLVDQNRTRLREWLPWLDKTKELKDTIAFIQFSHESEKSDGTMTMTIRLQGRLVGLVSFHRIDRTTSSTSMGYWISQDAEGRGVMKRSVAALIDYGFTQLNLLEISIKCASKNIRSAAIPERLGFKFKEIIPNAEWLYDHHVDHKVYVMKKTDWNVAALK